MLASATQAQVLTRAPVMSEGVHRMDPLSDESVEEVSGRPDGQPFRVSRELRGAVDSNRTSAGKESRLGVARSALGGSRLARVGRVYTSLPQDSFPSGVTFPLSPSALVPVGMVPSGTMCRWQGLKGAAPGVNRRSPCSGGTGRNSTGTGSDPQVGRRDSTGTLRGLDGNSMGIASWHPVPARTGPCGENVEETRSPTEDDIDEM